MHDTTDPTQDPATPPAPASHRGRKITIATLVTAGIATGGVYLAQGSFASGGSPSGAPSGSTSSPAKAPKPPAAPKHEPHIDGKVKSISGDTVTVTDPDGFTRTIELGSSTKFTKDGKSADRSALTTSSTISARGKVDANGTSLDATTVDIRTKAVTPPAGGPGRGPGALPAPGKGAPKAPSGNGKAPSGAPKAPSGAPKAPSGAPKAPSAAPSGGASSGS